MTLILELPETLENELKLLAQQNNSSVEDIAIELLEKDLQKIQSKKKLTPLEESRQLHEEIMARIRATNPLLQQNLTDEERKKRFDELSEKAAEGLPFSTVEEALDFLRHETFITLIEENNEIKEQKVDLRNLQDYKQP